MLSSLENSQILFLNTLSHSKTSQTCVLFVSLLERQPSGPLLDPPPRLQHVKILVIFYSHSKHRPNHEETSSPNFSRMKSNSFVSLVDLVISLKHQTHAKQRHRP